MIARSNIVRGGNVVGELVLDAETGHATLCVSQGMKLEILKMLLLAQFLEGMPVEINEDFEPKPTHVLKLSEPLEEDRLEA